MAETQGVGMMVQGSGMMVGTALSLRRKTARALHKTTLKTLNGMLIHGRNPHMWSSVIIKWSNMPTPSLKIVVLGSEWLKEGPTMLNNPNELIKMLTCGQMLMKVQLSSSKWHKMVRGGPRLNV